jgi:moderate conductance mechanosensitive channel
MDSEDTMMPVVAASERFVAGLQARYAALLNAGPDLAALQSAMAVQGWSLTGLAAAALVVVATAILSYMAVRRFLAGDRGSAPARAIATIAFAAVAAVAAGWLTAILIAEAGPVRRGLKALVFVTPAALVARAFILWVVTPDDRAVDTPSWQALRAFANHIGLATCSAFLGAATLFVLVQLGAGRGLLDATALLLVALPFVALTISAYWRARRPVARELAANMRGIRVLRRIAAVWPGIAIGLVLAGFVTAQMVITFGQKIPTIPAIVTLMMLMLSPHLDARIARWAKAGLDADKVTPAKVAMRQTLRPAALTMILVALLAVWSAPIAGLTGMTMADTIRPTIAIGVIVLASAFVQNLLGVAVDRALRREVPASGDHDEASTPRSRLGTLLPLIEGVARIATFTLAALTVLLALGVNIWPLITGLSVFGLAIGFGSQTLVKDIVSGLFFLFDDAFRHGEYIESSGAKGTVEKISVRSVSLRHPRGQVATVPYGQIGKITNFSRDWVIEKLRFRVAFDTDVDKVRKLFRTIGQELMEDPDLAADIIEPFKSQGIAEVDDGTLIIRGKFKAKAGRQFSTRKAVLAAVHKAFNEHGIRTVAQPLISDTPAR